MYQTHISFGLLQQMKHSRREEVWTNRGNLNICTKEKILRNQVTIGKLRVLRAITQHSLGKCPAAPIVLGPRNCVNRAAPLGLLRLEGGEQQGGQLVGQSNRLHGGLHSASPQHLADRSLIRILGSL